MAEENPEKQDNIITKSTSLLKTIKKYISTLVLGNLDSETTLNNESPLTASKLQERNNNKLIVQEKDFDSAKLKVSPVSFENNKANDWPRNTVYTQSPDWSDEDKFSDIDSYDHLLYNTKSQYFPNTIADFNVNKQNYGHATIDHEKMKCNEIEIENMKQELNMYRKQLECLMKTNCQLQSELDKSIQTNMFMEQCVTCPYVVKEGKIKFPGKHDLDNRFDCMFNALANIKNDLKAVQNDNQLARKLDKVLHLPLPGCPNNCHKNEDIMSPNL